MSLMVGLQDLSYILTVRLAAVLAAIVGANRLMPIPLIALEQTGKVTRRVLDICLRFRQLPALARKPKGTCRSQLDLTWTITTCSPV